MCYFLFGCTIGRAWSHFPDQGSIPRLQQWECRVLTTLNRQGIPWLFIPLLYILLLLECSFQNQGLVSGCGGAQLMHETLRLAAPSALASHSGAASLPWPLCLEPRLGLWCHAGRYLLWCCAVFPPAVPAGSFTMLPHPLPAAVDRLVPGSLLDMQLPPRTHCKEMWEPVSVFRYSISVLYIW